mmetsp:Transcript_3465/g.7573  ORF Transcript_3465/g.7573 Transcript_3465/m.7573 type:complete len:519 (-) Transcript_3465:77-1633(-)
MRLPVAVLLLGVVLQCRASQADDVISEEQRRLVCYLKSHMGCTASWAWRQIFSNAYLKDRLGDVSGKSCAVVSSSGALKNHSFGEEIDAHDIVIRFNKAPTAGYEKFVGSKTTMRLGWDFGGIAPKIFGGGYSQLNIAGGDALSYLYPTNIGQVRQSHDVTTGFSGMFLAFFGCAVVDSYEMTPSKYAAKAQYHYFGHNRDWLASNNAWHSDYLAEHNLWAHLSTMSWPEMTATGKTHMVGFSKVQCPADIPMPNRIESGAVKPLSCPLPVYRFQFSIVNLGDVSFDAELPCIANLIRILVSYPNNMSTPARCVEASLGTSQSVTSRRLRSSALHVTGTIATKALEEVVLSTLTSRTFAAMLCGNLVANASNKQCTITAVSLAVEVPASSTSRVAGSSSTAAPAPTSTSATAAAPASTATLVTSAAPSTPSALAPTTALPRMLASTTLRANDEDDRKKVHQAYSALPWWAWPTICCFPVFLIAVGCIFFMPVSAAGRRTETPKVSPIHYEVVHETPAE